MPGWLPTSLKEKPYGHVPLVTFESQSLTGLACLPSQTTLSEHQVMVNKYKNINFGLNSMVSLVNIEYIQYLFYSFAVFSFEVLSVNVKDVILEIL